MNLYLSYIISFLSIDSVFYAESRVTNEALNVSMKINNSNINELSDHESKLGLVGGSERLCRCGVTNTQKRIIDGEMADYEKFPWQAIFYFNDQFFCGGSLINDRYILSSAHCFYGFTHDEQEYITVRLLAPELEVENDDTIERQISRINLHYEYDPNSEDNDIALIQLEDPVRFNRRGLLRPICLPDADEDFVGDNGIVSGYGSTSRNSTIPSSYLFKEEVPIYTTEYCRTETSYLPDDISDNMFCAGHLDRETGPCYGDRGGPLQVLTGRRENRYVQVGIVSFGEDCAVPHYPTVYTKLTNYLKWIERLTTDATACRF